MTPRAGASWCIHTARTPVEGGGLGSKKEASYFLEKAGKVSTNHPA